MIPEPNEVVRHHRTGVVHAVTLLEGHRITYCGRLASRKMRRRDDLRLADVTCEKCWTSIASRHPRRRRVTEGAGT